MSDHFSESTSDGHRSPPNRHLHHLPPDDLRRRLLVWPVPLHELIQEPIETDCGFHLDRFERVATGKTDDAAGATGDWELASAGLRHDTTGSDHSAARRLGEEHDQDHKASVEEEQPGEDTSRCRQCGDEMTTRKQEWLGDIRTLVLLKIVAEILLGLRHDGESLLMQMMTALLAVNSRPGVNLSDTELQQVESMLLECPAAD